MTPQGGCGKTIEETRIEDLNSPSPQSPHPLGGSLGADAEGGRGRRPRGPLFNNESG